MVDGVLKWAKQQRKIWVREIALLESGKKTTSEVRRGNTESQKDDSFLIPRSGRVKFKHWRTKEVRHGKSDCTAG